LSFMNIDFEYNFRSIISVPGRALKAKKIFAASLCLLAALLCFDVFTYASWVLDGGDFGGLYALYGLVPITAFSFSSWICTILFYLGAAAAMIIVSIGMMAVSAFDIEELRGNPFLSVSQAMKFSCRRTWQLLLSWLTLLIFILFIAILGIIIGLIARIPIIGELLFSVLFFFPNFVVSIFTVLIIFVFILSLLVMPAAVSADRNGETFNSILETFSTIIKQPLRWAGYTAYSLLAAKVAGFVFAYFAYRAVQLLQFTTAIGGGDKIGALMRAGAAHLPIGSKAVAFTTSLFPGIDFGFDVSFLAGGGRYDNPVTLLMAASLFVIFLTIWGYILSVVATGQAYIYIVIKKVRDGYAITEEKSLFYREERVNPAIEKTDEPEIPTGNNKESN
jgi:hypothetical protein